LASTNCQTDILPGVLLVDDEPAVLSALVRSMKSADYRLITALSGEEGLTALGSERNIQVVVSDFRMPGMDGVDFLLQIKKRYPDIQRVMLTGQADSQAVERAINQCEVFRFINKPWNVNQLRATIAECLDRYRLVQRARRAEEELARRNAELEEMNRHLEQMVAERTRALLQSEKIAALGRMAGGVAHQINNPLGGILAFTQVLRRDAVFEEKPQLGEALHTIEDCALRCKDIVDRMLSFSRREPVENKKLLDLNAVAENAMALARLHPRSKLVAIDFQRSPEPALVWGSKNALEQVALNLLQNALQASPENRPVRLRVFTDADQRLLEVSDDGPGIAEEDLSKIFEPFFTTRQPGEGTGLGLFVSWGIVRDHQGEIRVESQPGRGATFRVVLPAPREA
jgi:signal transduction histidine kinase